MTGRARPAVAAMSAYAPGRSAADAAADHGVDDAVKLASNEVAFGPLPSVATAIGDGCADVARYPDHRATELRRALATALGIDPVGVTVGAGSVGLLQQLVLAYVDPGEQVAMCWPSFEAYPVYAALVGAEQVRVPLRAHAFDLPALAAAITPATKLVFVADPNNPTGTVVGTDAIVELLDAVPPTCLVVLDEAYREFVTDPAVRDSIPLVARHPNLVVTRTFSKAYGLAALRVGYAVGHPDVISMIDRTLVPFVVNALGQRAALASLAATGEMRRRVAAVVAERERVVASLHDLALPVPDPQGNFVFLPAGADSVALGTALERRGVVGRVFPEVGLRVTIGTPAENDRFLAALGDAIEEHGTVEWEAGDRAGAPHG